MFNDESGEFEDFVNVNLQEGFKGKLEKETPFGCCADCGEDLELKKTSFEGAESKEPPPDDSPSSDTLAACDGGFCQGGHPTLSHVDKLGVVTKSDKVVPQQLKRCGSTAQIQIQTNKPSNTIEHIDSSGIKTDAANELTAEEYYEQYIFTNDVTFCSNKILKHNPVNFKNYYETPPADPNFYEMLFSKIGIFILLITIPKIIDPFLPLYFLAILIILQSTYQLWIQLKNILHEMKHQIVNFTINSLFKIKVYYKFVLPEMIEIFYHEFSNLLRLPLHFFRTNYPLVIYNLCETVISNVEKNDIKQFFYITFACLPYAVLAKRCANLNIKWVRYFWSYIYLLLTASLLLYTMPNSPDCILPFLFVQYFTLKYVRLIYKIFNHTPIIKKQIFVKITVPTKYIKAEHFLNAAIRTVGKHVLKKLKQQNKNPENQNLWFVHALLPKSAKIIISNLKNKLKLCSATTFRKRKKTKLTSLIVTFSDTTLHQFSFTETVSTTYDDPPMDITRFGDVEKNPGPTSNPFNISNFLDTECQVAGTQPNYDEDENGPNEYVLNDFVVADNQCEYISDAEPVPKKKKRKRNDPHPMDSLTKSNVQNSNVKSKKQKTIHKSKPLQNNQNTMYMLPKFIRDTNPEIQIRSPNSVQPLKSTNAPPNHSVLQIPTNTGTKPFVYIDTDGSDANCFFHSLAYGFRKRKIYEHISHKTLRKLVAAQIKKCPPTEYTAADVASIDARGFNSSIPPNMYTWDMYSQQMAQSGTYAGDAEFGAVNQILKKLKRPEKIFIVNASDGSINSLFADQRLPQKGDIVLHYASTDKSGHYSVLERLDTLQTFNPPPPDPTPDPTPEPTPESTPDLSLKTESSSEAESTPESTSDPTPPLDPKSNPKRPLENGENPDPKKRRLPIDLLTTNEENLLSFFDSKKKQYAKAISEIITLKHKGALTLQKLYLPKILNGLGLSRKIILEFSKLKFTVGSTEIPNTDDLANCSIKYLAKTLNRKASKLLKYRKSQKMSAALLLSTLAQEDISKLEKWTLYGIPIKTLFVIDLLLTDENKLLSFFPKEEKEFRQAITQIVNMRNKGELTLSKLYLPEKFNGLGLPKVIIVNFAELKFFVGSDKIISSNDLSNCSKSDLTAIIGPSKSSKLINLRSSKKLSDKLILAKPINLSLKEISIFTEQKWTLYGLPIESLKLAEKHNDLSFMSEKTLKQIVGRTKVKTIKNILNYRKKKKIQLETLYLSKKLSKELKGLGLTKLETATLAKSNVTINGHTIPTTPDLSNCQNKDLKFLPAKKMYKLLTLRKTKKLDKNLLLTKPLQISRKNIATMYKQKFTLYGKSIETFELIEEPFDSYEILLDPPNREKDLSLCTTEFLRHFLPQQKLKKFTTYRNKHKLSIRILTTHIQMNGLGFTESNINKLHNSGATLYGKQLKTSTLSNYELTEKIITNMLKPKPYSRLYHNIKKFFNSPIKLICFLYLPITLNGLALTSTQIKQLSKSNLHVGNKPILSTIDLSNYSNSEKIIPNLNFKKIEAYRKKKKITTKFLRTLKLQWKSIYSLIKNNVTLYGSLIPKPYFNGPELTTMNHTDLKTIGILGKLSRIQLQNFPRNKRLTIQKLIYPTEQGGLNLTLDTVKKLVQMKFKIHGKQFLQRTNDLCLLSNVELKDLGFSELSIEYLSTIQPDSEINIGTLINSFNKDGLELSTETLNKIISKRYTLYGQHIKRLRPQSDVDLQFCSEAIMKMFKISDEHIEKIVLFRKHNEINALELRKLGMTGSKISELAGKNVIANKDYLIPNIQPGIGKIPLEEFDIDQVPRHHTPHRKPCEKCRALLFPGERESFCCHQGKIDNDELHEPIPYPDDMKKLFEDGNTDEEKYKSKIFLNRLRPLNQMNSFCSFSCDNEIPYTGCKLFKVSGGIHHWIGSIIPKEGEDTKFMQFYFHQEHNNDDEVFDILTKRLNKRRSVTNKVGKKETDMLRKLFLELRQDVKDNHAIYKAFDKFNKDALKNNHERVLEQATEKRHIIFSGRDKENPSNTYCKPASNRIIGVIQHSPGEKPKERHVYVEHQSGNKQRVLEADGNYDPLHYVLLFPFGSYGWYYNLENKQGEKISCKDYYRFRIQDRVAKDKINDYLKSIPPDPTKERSFEFDQFNPIVQSRMLFQQYIVDMAVKNESNNLNFLRSPKQQLNMRFGTLENHRKAIESGEIEDEGRIVLPASFYGGPKHMLELFNNSMAVVRRYGKPHLFITFTCNQNWPEIQRELRPGQTPEDRFEIVSRVFQDKLRRLVETIKGNKSTKHEGIFGESRAIFYSIEMQQRGNPHAHMVVMLKNTEIAPEDFHKYTTAELPHPTEQEDLYKLVTKHMIHLPCDGIDGNSKLCQTSSKQCKSYFPKEYLNVAEYDMYKFPKYLRRPPDSPDKKGHTYEPLSKFNDKTKRMTFKNIHGETNPVTITNKWVVPYNPTLLQTFDAHINVEVVSTNYSVKYLYKYLLKGNCKAWAKLTDPEKKVDEPKAYTDSRVNCPADATYRLFSQRGFMQKFYNTYGVNRLPVHELGKNYLSLLKCKRCLDTEDLETTKLTEFFEFCETHKDIMKDPKHQFLYHEMPEHFVWDINLKKWKIPFREKKKDPAYFPIRGVNPRRTVGRMPFINPSRNKVFFLRTLLLHMRSPKSYDDLKMCDPPCSKPDCSDPDACHHEKPICESKNCDHEKTFRAMCVHMGLIRDGRIWFDTMQDLEDNSCHVKKIRETFVSILAFSKINKPEALFNKFKYAMSDDFVRNLPNKGKDHHHDTRRKYQVQKLILYLIATLPEFGLDFDDFFSQKLRDYVQDFQELHPNPIVYGKRLIEDEEYTAELQAQHYETLLSKGRLNKDQQHAFDTIKNAVENDNDVAKVFFLNGPAGSGKTHTYKALSYYFRSNLNSHYQQTGKHPIVLNVASTGIASTLLPGGRTAHSRFRIPVGNIHSQSTCNIDKKRNNKFTELAELLRETKLIIWDECPATHRHNVEAVDASLRDILDKPNLPFGGICFVMGGDFAQLLPIVDGGQRMTVAATLKASPIWKYINDDTTLLLEKNIRSTDKKYSKWLLKMARKHDPDFYIRDDLLMDDDKIETLCDWVYDGLDKKENISNPEWFKDRAILCPRNISVTEINEYMNKKFLELYPELYPEKDTAQNCRTYLSKDEALDTMSPFTYEMEHFNALTPSGYPPHKLQLIVGAPVMLLKNINPPEGHTNGQRYTVLQLLDNVVVLKPMFSDDPEKILYVHKVDHLPADKTKTPFSLWRVQFPLKNCWSMSVHKSQGSTLKKVGIYLAKHNFFAHAHAYVACSRVSSFKGLRFSITPNPKKRVTTIFNKVFEELFTEGHEYFRQENSECTINGVTYSLEGILGENEDEENNQTLWDACYYALRRTNFTMNPKYMIDLVLNYIETNPRKVKKILKTPNNKGKNFNISKIEPTINPTYRIVRKIDRLNRGKRFRKDKKPYRPIVRSIWNPETKKMNLFGEYLEYARNDPLYAPFGWELEVLNAALKDYLRDKKQRGERCEEDGGGGGRGAETRQFVCVCVCVLT